MSAGAGALVALDSYMRITSRRHGMIGLVGVLPNPIASIALGLAVRSCLLPRGPVWPDQTATTTYAHATTFVSMAVGSTTLGLAFFLYIHLYGLVARISMLDGLVEALLVWHGVSLVPLVLYWQTCSMATSLSQMSLDQTVDLHEDVNISSVPPAPSAPSASASASAPTPTQHVPMGVPVTVWEPGSIYRV